MPVLSVENLNVGYGQVQILWDVAFAVQKGQTVSLLGNNGAGKTTAVKTISGLLRPTNGRVIFEGVDITDMPAHKRVEVGLVQVPEGRKIFPTLSVIENLEMGSFLKGPKLKRAKTLAKILEIFPVLGDRSHQVAGTLSGGEQQMLALGRGLMSLPNLLILDEPSVGLAPLMVMEIFKAIEEIKREGVSILLVEQNVAQSLTISNHAYILEDGRIGLSGTGTNLLNDDNVRRLYLGVGAD